MHPSITGLEAINCKPLLAAVNAAGFCESLVNAVVTSIFLLSHNWIPASKF